MTTLAEPEQRAVLSINGQEIEEGGFGLDQSEILPPRLQFNGQSGVFKFYGEENTIDDVQAVPLIKLLPSRIKFDKDAKDTVIECRSNDGMMPIDLAQAAEIGAGPSCRACPYAQFGPRNESGKATAPACTEYYNLAMASIPEAEDEEPEPFLFSAHGTGIKPLSQALALLTKWKQKEKLPGYSYVLELSAGAPVGRGREQYRPLVVRPAQDENRQLVRVAQDLWPAMRDLWHLMAELRNRPMQAVSQEPAFDENGEPL